MLMIRRVGAAILAVAAIAVWFLMGPDDSSVTNRAEQINQALADYEQNESLTSGAPQQTVVNGWVAKDLLTVIARVENDAARAQAGDDRVSALVGLVVLGLALGIATSSQGSAPTAAALTPGPAPHETQPAGPGAIQAGGTAARGGDI